MSQLRCPNCMAQTPPQGACEYCGCDPAGYRPAPHHLPPGALLAGKYQLGRVLGEGGFGITYIGWDTKL